MKAKLLKSRLWICVALASMTLLTGCLSGSLNVQSSAPISQPRYLTLSKGQPIQAKQGVYTPATDETWCSPAVVEAKDRIILEQARALERLGVNPYLPARQ